MVAIICNMWSISASRRFLPRFILSCNLALTSLALTSLALTSLALTSLALTSIALTSIAVMT